MTEALPYSITLKEEKNFSEHYFVSWQWFDMLQAKHMWTGSYCFVPQAQFQNELADIFLAVTTAMKEH